MKKRNRKRGKVDKLPCDIRETVDIWKPNVTTEIRLDDGSINIDSLDAQEYSTEAYMTNVFDAERKT